MWSLKVSHMQGKGLVCDQQWYPLNKLSVCYFLHCKWWRVEPVDQLQEDGLNMWMVNLEYDCMSNLSRGSCSLILTLSLTRHCCLDVKRFGMLMYSCILQKEAKRYSCLFIIKYAADCPYPWNACIKFYFMSSLTLCLDNIFLMITLSYV